MPKNATPTVQVLTLNQHAYYYYPLNAVADTATLARLPYSLKILLENLLRTGEDPTDLLHWDPSHKPSHEISFTPARVILQDFTGVPVVVDLAAMRQAMADLGGDPNKINPLSPVDLVIDHSVMVDHFGKNAFAYNTQVEFERNQERYTFLRWGQTAFKNFRVVPPGTGIVHQVNLEYLASVVFVKEDGPEGKNWIYPDTLVGTDSHTTMINGLGVLGWGVGGIEAEAAMLGQPIPLLIPEVVGFEISGSLKEGATATDVVLRVVEILRQQGVVDKFVEFFGDGLAHLPLADRATIANMAPEYGATCGIFPIDEETLSFLRLSGRSEKQVQLVEAYAKAQGLFRVPGQPAAHYSQIVKLHLADIEPAIAGPRRPQDRVPLTQAKTAFQKELGSLPPENPGATLQHGAVVIAAITSCTNTSNPTVMLAAGLLAQKAVALGLRTPTWVKTSLAPGSQVVTDYLKKANVLSALETLGFSLVGYGCTTCIGNSGPLPEAVSQAIAQYNLTTCAVLSGNRNFEGRIHPEVKFAYLASPPLVVAYALAGSLLVDITRDPLGYNKEGQAVYLKEIWPTQAEIQAAVRQFVRPQLFQERYQHVFEGNAAWQQLQIPASTLYEWNEHSTYVKYPPYFEGMTKNPDPLQDIQEARVLALLGNSVTTDHISPAGDISVKGPAGQYLTDHHVPRDAFNSFGARRGNHEVMMRGTFANIRLRNLLAPGTEGGVTLHLPTGETLSIYEAAMKYKATKTPLIILAGLEYGTGSSRDWAAKGTRLLGARAVIAQSFERIHRSNLIGMGVLPLEFMSAENTASYGLTGEEFFTISLNTLKIQGTLTVIARHPEGKITRFPVKVRIDTPKELEYYQHGGILQYVLRGLL